MKTPKEIKKALGCCSRGVSWSSTCAKGCPYLDVYKCATVLQSDALAYIAQLEETISLMMIQMRGDCGCCKHGRDMARCNKCLTSREGYHPLWEYEGLPEVLKDDKPM